MKNYNKKLASIIIIVGIIIVFINTFYFWFINDEFSRNSSDWGAFGDYISGISSFFNLVFFVYISFWLYKWGKKDSVNEQIRESITKCMESLAETRFFIVELELSKEVSEKDEICRKIKKSLLRLYTNNTVFKSKIEISYHKHNFKIDNLKNGMQTLIKFNDYNLVALKESKPLENDSDKLLAEVDKINENYIDCLKLVR